MRFLEFMFRFFWEFYKSFFFLNFFSLAVDEQFRFRNFSKSELLVDRIRDRSRGMRNPRLCRISFLEKQVLI